MNRTLKLGVARDIFIIYIIHSSIEFFHCNGVIVQLQAVETLEFLEIIC